jgi:hypothetical protein
MPTFQFKRPELLTVPLPALPVESYSYACNVPIAEAYRRLAETLESRSEIRGFPAAARNGRY